MSLNCVGPLIHRLFSILSWGSMDVEGQLYALFYAILNKGLEHPWILVSEGGPGTNLHCGY